MRRPFLTSLVLVLIILSAAVLPSQVTAVQTFTCPGAPPTRLAIGVNAKVSDVQPGQEAAPVRVRVGAGTASEVIGQLQSGDSFLITEGPVCADGYVWWRIQAVPDLSGWVAEGVPGHYFLDPITPENSTAIPTALPQTPTLDAASIECPNAPKTQLNVGMRGAVRPAKAGATPNSVRVREKPSKTGKQVGNLEQGIPFTITAGPQCADDFVWWQIKADNGLAGWVAEGTPDKYNIVPFSQAFTPTPGVGSGAGGRVAIVRPIDCPGALPTRLGYGATGRVLPGKTVVVRENAAPNSNRVTRTLAGEAFSGQLTEGQTFTINGVTGGSLGVCNNGVIWWEVVINGSIVGYIAEAVDGEYLVEPISPVAIAAPIRYVAPGLLPTRLPTRTATPNPTITLTPSATLSPTITQTPSITPTSGATPTPGKGKSSAVLSVAFAPDAKTFLAGYADGSARLWDVESGAVLREMTGKMDAVISVEFSWSGVYALTASKNGLVLIWVIASDQAPKVYDVHDAGKLNCAHFSPNGKYLLTCSDDGTARLWTLGTPDPPRLIKAGTSPILSAIFGGEAEYGADPNEYGSPFLILGASDGYVTAWQYRDETHLLLRWQVRTQLPIKSIAINAEYIILVSSLPIYWPSPKGIEPDEGLSVSHQILLTSDNVIAAAAVGFDSALSFSGTTTIKLYEDAPPGMGGYAQPAMQYAEAKGHTATITSMAFSPIGAFLLTGSLDKTVRLWEVPNFDIPKILQMKELRQFKLP